LRRFFSDFRPPYNFLTTYSQAADSNFFICGKIQEDQGNAGAGLILMITLFSSVVILLAVGNSTNHWGGLKRSASVLFMVFINFR
jgi:hypothetical protein